MWPQRGIKKGQSGLSVTVTFLSCAAKNTLCNLYIPGMVVRGKITSIKQATQKPVKHTERA